MVIGTKTGKLQLFDVNAGLLLEATDAHEGAVWSLALLPDKVSMLIVSFDDLILRCRYTYSQVVLIFN